MNKLFYIIILLSFAKQISAQHIAGKVFTADGKGNKEEVSGATVYWFGTSVSSTSDSIGMFSIPNPDTIPAQLIVTMVGFLTDTIRIEKFDRSDVFVVLKNSVNLNIVEVAEKQGLAAIQVDGKFVDYPIVYLAKKLIERANAIQKNSLTKN